MTPSETQTRQTSDTLNTNQHYVAQMLLRGFVIAPDGEQVYVFDKRTGKSFPTAVRNIAAEKGYYDLAGSAVLDAAMNRADGITASIIKKIRERRSLFGISLDDRGILAGFVAMQMLRTRGYQEQMKHLAQIMANKIAELRDRMSPEMRARFSEEQTDEQLREEYLQMIPKFTETMVPHLLDKNLLLFKTDRNKPFCISDNPVVLNNTLNPGDDIRGTLGLAVPGIEIYLPISSELTLAYMCPSVGQSYEEISDRLWRLGGFIKEEAYAFLQARDIGKPMLLNAENVRFQNSLQARQAERFVISSINDWTDAANMVENNPKSRFGPRVTTN